MRLFNQCITLNDAILLGDCSSARISLDNNLLSRFEEATFKEVLIQMESSPVGYLDVQDSK